MKKVFAFLCFSAIVTADDQVRKLIELKYADVHTIRPLLDGYNAHINMGASPTMFTVVGSKDAVADVEELIRKLDVPVADIELTAHLILGSVQPTAGAAVPADLEAVAKQLRALFPYRGLRVLESFVLRSREGLQATTGGFLPPANANAPVSAKTHYDFSFEKSKVSAGVFHFDVLRLVVKVPISTNQKGEVVYVNNVMTTNVDIREGQKVVVGKAGAMEGGENALFLVISAKVVE